MTVRLRYHIEVGLSSTCAEGNDLGHLVSEVVADTQGKGGVFKTVLAAGATDVPISLDNIGATRFLFLKTNTVDPTLALSSVLIRRNLITNEQIELAPLPGAKEAHLVLLNASLAAIFASNSGMAAVELTVAMAGD
jgi:hypothetical protein